MKIKYLLLLVLFLACKGKNQSSTGNDSIPSADTSVAIPPSDSSVTSTDTTGLPGNDTTGLKQYSNSHFRKVTVQQTGPHKFLVKGQAQVFEAAFSWVVEDGHNELKQGHEMTDAGAPAFGHFSFTVDVAKQRKTSTLTLILFEASAKDGSRLYELPIPLY